MHALGTGDRSGGYWSSNEDEKGGGVISRADWIERGEAGKAAEERAEERAAEGL